MGRNGRKSFFLFLWVNNERSGVYVIHEKSCQTQNAWNNARLDFVVVEETNAPRSYGAQGANCLTGRIYVHLDGRKK